MSSPNTTAAVSVGAAVSAAGVQKYKKHTHHQHILELPDTYIGSTATTPETRWVYDASSGKMVWRALSFTPGLFKIFDEIIVNARDEYVRSTTIAGMTPVKHIDVAVASNGDGSTIISVENDGNGIPIEKHEDGVMMPEMIFGQLLTSSNYDKSEAKIVGGRNGYGGKCVSRDTKVPLWTGEIKMAHEVREGDQVIGDDGLPRTVQSIFYGSGPMYRVEQAHGEPYVVNDQHILTLHVPDHKTIFWNASKHTWSMIWWDQATRAIRYKNVHAGPTPSHICEECKGEFTSHLARHYRRVHPTVPFPKAERKKPTYAPETSMESLLARKELEEFAATIPDDSTFDISIQDYLAFSPTIQTRLAGVRGQCIQWPTKEVELDPYVLGLWLGDGFANGYGYACYGEKDPEIIMYLNEWCEKNEATLTKGGTYMYRFSSKEHKGKKGSAPLKKQLAHYGLIQNKHIPRDYLCNDRATRLAVLAGFIDTDGSVSRDGTRVRISQGMNHEALFHDMVFLARSLGFSCQIGIYPTTWTYRGEKRTGQAYTMNLSGKGMEDIPTRLPRKKCASTVDKNTSKSTGWLTIHEAEVNEYVGLQIDGNERFLINDCTVTHNCSNIFSTLFSIDLKTPISGKHYMQSWYNNMYQVEKPTIKAYKGAKGSVKITFVPDRTRFPGAFDETGIVSDMIACFHTRVVELAGLVGKDVKVTWNGTLVGSNTFEKYMKLFLRDGMTGYAYEQAGPRWEMGIVLARHLYSEEEELPEDKHVSFVNGVNTKKGGKHVESVARKIMTDFCEVAKKKKVDIKPGQLKNAIVLFLNSTIVNPSFDSQSKEYLTTPPADFGSKPEYSGKLMDALVKLGLMEEAKFLLEAKTLREAKKTDGKKRSTIRGMTKLEDALWAGTAKSRECTLIVTEGDSAATSAISGLKEVGRERWGVFPLRGKLLNVRDITIQKFNANEELTSIKKILGLEQGKVYQDASELRYGRIMIMADQDHDGSHIKGLLMNLFHTEWPGLLHAGFMCTLLTPILKATKGKQTLSFYSLPEFLAWKETLGGPLTGWSLKYYKGLGTSTPAEAREWFKTLHEIQYVCDEKTDESLLLAFHKKQADDRKRWLAHYDPHQMLQVDGNKATYSNFIHSELIHFSHADNIRSLPHLMDGLKPSQRKIIYCCLKRNLKEEIRVAQLAGYVSEHAAYHHGEASLNGTIIGMAQNFMGSNNINLLRPMGQFGSRILGGKDAASPRYIHTYMEDIVRYLFRKEDACLLKHMEDDGDLVEPEYYLPVVPLLAINGSIGIGTGYSTDIPPHKPDDIICLLRHRLQGSIDTLAGRPQDPWWFGFKGSIHRVDDVTWQTKGLYVLDDVKHTVTITELPVGTWTKDYKAFLEQRLEVEEKRNKEAKKEAKKAETGSQSSSKGEIEPCGFKGCDDLYNDVDVCFVLYFTEEGYEAIKDHPEVFEKQFKLTTSWKTTNMTCFDASRTIVKYRTIGDLLEAFLEQRLPLYEARRHAILGILKGQNIELDAKRRFLQAVLDERLILQKKTDDDIVKQLMECAIPPLSCMDQPYAYDSYDYVLRMRMDRVKQSAIEELDGQIREKETEIARLEGETAASLWLADLAELEQAWNRMAAARTAESVAVASSESAVKAPRKRRPTVAKPHGNPTP